MSVIDLQNNYQLGTKTVFYCETLYKPAKRRENCSFQELGIEQALNKI